MKIYIAGPLFNQMETERNYAISSFLEKNGFETYLPQRDGGLFYELRNKGFTEDQIKNLIFDTDYRAIMECQIILCLLDGRVPDEGMCIELGIAYALKKYCIGFKTDHRCHDKFGDNIMLEGALNKIVFKREHLLDELINYGIIINNQKEKFTKV